jgi:hypothetical protein
VRLVLLLGDMLRLASLPVAGAVAWYYLASASKGMRAMLLWECCYAGLMGTGRFITGTIGLVAW